RACGCENVVECQDTEGPAALQTAIDSQQKTVIVCHCESGNIKLPVIETDPAVIRHRFMAALSAANA
ncbi:MAG: sulfopyruvate decarboxylase subunit beta, partial [Pseudomonadota bacterium]